MSLSRRFWVFSSAFDNTARSFGGSGGTGFNTSSFRFLRAAGSGKSVGAMLIYSTTAEKYSCRAGYTRMLEMFEQSVRESDAIPS